MTNQKAILAGGCFWGMQELIRKQPGWSRPGSATPAVTSPTRPTATTAPTPRPSRSSTTRRKPITGRSWSFLPDPRPDNERPPGQRPRPQLPVGDLLPGRGAEADRAGHHRRRRGVRPVARQGGDRGQPGRRLLGGRARAPGLPAALSERIHLPLHPPGLEAAASGRLQPVAVPGEFSAGAP